ncbi:MAG: hypothetical protein IH941_07150 [Acidobacteria bacterium]|nr:hypothetical protein [Acidobacteriota bacterium]
MPRSCTVCGHAKRNIIDDALVSGTSLRNVAEQFRLKVTSLHRHKHSHVPATLAKAHEAREVAAADSLLDRLEQLTGEARRVKTKAERAGDLRTALAAIRELVRMVELLAKLRGELDESPRVALVLVPEWRQVLHALQPFPGARLAVARALEDRSEGRVDVVEEGRET